MTSVEVLNNLLDSCGPMIGGKDLMKALGFKTMPAFRKALREGRINVKVFDVPGHRGKFALTTQVANFINQCAEGS